MKNLHLLPTEQPSRLHTYKGLLNLAADEFVAPAIIKNDLINQNIYITNDEEIKEGDWVIQINYEKTNINLIKCVTEAQTKIANDKNGSFTKNKIILTTDSILIADGVQAIDDEFLEWFVKNPSCEWVETFIDTMGCTLENCDANPCINYKIIIPVEEPKYPIGGYTPGNYYCTCISCNVQFQGDKRACQCKSCATEMTKEEPKQECKGSFKDCFKPLDECICHTMEQETLEEFIESYVNLIDRSEDGLVEQCLKDGATWQQKRSFSEEDMKLAFETGRNFQLTGENNFSELINNLKSKL